MANMHKLPWETVIDYAEQDVTLTLNLWNKFKGLIKKPIKTDAKKTKTLENIFDIETRLFPCLVDMRFKGVRVDEEKNKNFLEKEIQKQKDEIVDAIEKENWNGVDVWASDSIKPLLDKLEH